MSDVFYYLKCDQEGRLIVSVYSMFGEREDHVIETDELPNFVRKSPFFQKFLSFYGLDIDFKK